MNKKNISTMDVRRQRSVSWARATTFLLGLAICLGWAAMQAVAQTGGDGAIAGTVTDGTGAVISNASVTAINVGTNVATTRPTTSAGYYTIAPLIPGKYTVTVSASGFEIFKQENMVVDAMHTSGLNIVMRLGSQSLTVTVTDAPPALETTNAVLGGTMENDIYMDLPLMVSGNQQRDITQFSNLLPGAQVNPAGRSSVIGGTAARLGELYLDGIPMTTGSQQGDNRPIFNLVPMEAIEQIQVVTSGFTAEYQGAGMENYTLKSGTNKFHGSVVDFARNSAFDTWGFSSPAATKTVSVGGVLTTVPQGKPQEHQNELSATVGGPISIPHLFSGRDKLFFNATYDKTHTRSATNPTAGTIPTVAMQGGSNRTGPADFSALTSTYAIYDPTSQVACTANSTTGTCRYQYGYGPGTGLGVAGNPVLLGANAPVNVIPASEVSPISTYLESFLPAPINTNTSGNYLGGIPGGYDNYLYAGHVDYDLSAKQRISASYSFGQRTTFGYAVAAVPLIPVPYLQGAIAVVNGKIADFEHTYTFTPNLLNQFKYGWVNFGGPPIKNATEGITQYEAQTAGITGLPTGQAADEFPTVNFGGTTNPFQTQWGEGASGATATSVSETYTLVDNLRWIKGKHAITGGFQLQWLEVQASSYDGPSSILSLNYLAAETANVSGTSYPAGTGYPYASYMLGAINSTTTSIQSVSELGGRFRPMAPYFQDDYKVTPKLTLNIGLRWDYIPTYREAQDRWSFLDPTAVNPAVADGSMKGALMFAGNHGGSSVSIGKPTPVDNYFKNWGPRIGFSYSLNDKTVIRGGYGLLYSHAGGTGGAGGAAVGTGQTGFNTPLSFIANVAGPTAAPAFYLNPNIPTTTFSTPNSNYGGANYTLPTNVGPSAAAQLLSVGNFVGATAAAAAAPGYPDPYLAGRAPEFDFWNFGIQRELSRNTTITINYSGSESHFIAGAGTMRGIQSGGVDPKYMTLLGSGGPTSTYNGTSGLGALSQPATTAEIQAVNTATGLGLTVPYTGYDTYATSGAFKSQATIGQMLKWMPQFSGTTDTWGNVANANYHALQVSLALRQTHGLSLNVNYTYSKQMDDAGTNRSGFAIPATSTLDKRAWARNRIDYSLSTLSEPQQFAAFGVYKLPFGKGGIGADNFLVRNLLGGWDFSSIATYVSGVPLTLSSSACSSYSVGQGTCMPDINPSFEGGKNNIRQNGKWGKGVTPATLGTLSYVRGFITKADGVSANTTPGQGVGGVACAASTGPFCNAGYNMIGNAPRTAPFGLRAPNTFRLSSGIKRSFDISSKAKFIFAADCQNVTNAVTFGVNGGNLQIPTGVNVKTFGTLVYASADSRDFQFSGRITF
jgi:hypothetical protein